MANNRKSKKRAKERASEDVELALEDGWRQEDLDGLDDDTFAKVVDVIKRGQAEDDGADDDDDEAQGEDDDVEEDDGADDDDDEAQGEDDDVEEDDGADDDDEATPKTRSGGPRMNRGRTLSDDERAMRQEADDFGQTIPARTF